MRRALSWGATVVVALAGLIVVLLVLSGRDKASVGTSSSGPGVVQRDLGDRHLAAPAHVRYASSPPSSGPHVVVPMPAQDGVRLSDDLVLSALERGNIVIAYPGAQAPAALRAVQHSVQMGAYAKRLADEGQAVLLGRYPTGGDYVALSWGRMLRTRTPTDPRLGDFADHWLGVGAPGH